MLKTVLFWLCAFVIHSYSAQNVDYEVYAELPESVGNIAFTDKGEMVYSHHPFFKPVYSVMKYNAETKTSEPFPTIAWNTPRTTDDYFLSDVLGIRNDANGIVWMLDMGTRYTVTPKIVGWNTAKDALERIYYLPKNVIKSISQPNDLLVDTKHGVFIIADEGIARDGDGSLAALIVVDMKTGMSRRLLENTRFTKPEKIPITVNGKDLKVEGKTIYVGCDGITADKEFEWLYFAPLNGTKLYRVKIEDLLNENLTDEALSALVEAYSEKPNNGGLSIDSSGNIYLTAVESNSVCIIRANDKALQSYFTDSQLLWPDGISYNVHDDYMYVSAAQVHLGAVFHSGKQLAKAPYLVYRFKPKAPGVPFR